MAIKVIDPINQESLVRDCISEKNQEKYLKKILKGKVILYAYYEKRTCFGVTGIEFNRQVNYFDLQGSKNYYNCDYICVGHIFKKLRNRGAGKILFNHILDNHFNDYNEIGFSLTGNRKCLGKPKRNLQKIFDKNLNRGFRVLGYRPEHFGPFMVFD